MRALALTLVLFAILGGACSTTPATSPEAGPPTSSAAPSPPPAASSAPPAPVSAAASPVADAAPPASSAASAPPPAPAGDDGPVPKVGLANIGMHIGGGPNDDVTKDPIRRSVAPHFDELRRCFPKVEDPTKTGDFGVDLRIDKAGGKARVSHPRTALKGKDFKDCVVAVFEGIDFLKPRGGTTTVSYSLRFTPAK